MPAFRRHTPPYCPRYVVSSAFIRAIMRSTDTYTALSYPAGLHLTQLSSIVHGRSFGPSVAVRIIMVGKRLGLKAGRCTRPVRGSR